VKQGALAGVRGRLEEFAAEVFAPLVRSDQRAKGETYLRGLLLDGRRKSMQPMAERLGVDHQGLQQFISSSTWEVTAVRARLARLAHKTVAPEAWVVDDTGFLKDGSRSPCVARQYTGTAGKVTNCQVGVSVHMVTDAASAAVNWRLFVPQSWDDACAAEDVSAAEVVQRRARCAIPDTERNRPKWTMAVEMLDELAEWKLTPPVVVADAGYGDNAHFRAALEDRDLSYVVQVKGEVTAHTADAVPQSRPYSGRGRHPQPRYRDKPISLRRHVLGAGRNAGTTITWREGSRGSLRSDFIAMPVRVAGRKPRPQPDGSLPPRWLIAQWPPDTEEPVKYWISNLPADTPATELVRLAKIRWRVEHDYRELKTGLGLDHFEGRSFTGWHRHVTLASAAHLFLTTLRLTSPKASGAA
jgi:SRSO17 transposase